MEDWVRLPMLCLAFRRGMAWNVLCHSQYLRIRRDSVMTRILKLKFPWNICMLHAIRRKMKSRVMSLLLNLEQKRGSRIDTMGLWNYKTFMNDITEHITTTCGWGMINFEFPNPNVDDPGTDKKNWCIQPFFFSFCDDDTGARDAKMQVASTHNAIKDGLGAGCIIFQANSLDDCSYDALLEQGNAHELKK